MQPVIVTLLFPVSRFFGIIRTRKAMQKMDKKELEEWREHLLRYCELDTFAMVKVLEKLKEVVK